jgi:hypothetical protein
MRTRKFKRTKIKKHKGGGLILNGAEVNQSLIDEIINLFKNPIFLGAGTSGIAFLTSDVLPQMCNPAMECHAKFIVKIIPIDSDFEERLISEFNKECAIQRDIYVRLLTAFNYSFVPMIIYSKIYTKEEFTESFPTCITHVKLTEQIEDIDAIDKFGVIIMESFGDVERLKKTDAELPIALREMFMLAQVGYKDDSRSLDNFLISKNEDKHVYMIDFGTAEPIDPIPPINPDQEIEVLSELYKSDIIVEDDEEIDLKSEKIINLTKELALTEDVFGRLQMTDKIKESSIDLIKALSRLTGGRKNKSRRKHAKRQMNIR